MRVKIPLDFVKYLRVGACSWKYDSWKGLYYDEEREYGPNDYLPDYAGFANTVEIDQWFWSLFPGGLKFPEPDTVTMYANSVPDDFVFSVKAPNALTLTHFYAKQPKQHVDFAGRPNIYFGDVGVLNRFLELIAPLGKKLGPIMFQYEFLNRMKMRSLDEFIDKVGSFLSRAPSGFEYCIEIRNPEYLSDPFFDFLADHKLGFVYLDGYRMPPIGEVFERFHPSTAHTSVIRLHGPDRLAVEKQTGEVWNRIVAPKPKGLRDAARIVRANRDRGMMTFVNINNHYEGSAPITIGRFLEALMKGE